MAIFLKRDWYIAATLILSVLVWSLGLPAWVRHAYAANLTQVSDTISDSDLSATANHTIKYTAANTVEAGEEIKIQFDPSGDAFSLGTLAFADISFTGATLVVTCGAGGDEVTVVVDATAPDENITFTVCTGDTVTAGAKTIVLGNDKITNPSSAGSYVIRITSGATPVEKSDTRVAIIDDVVVTASVATNFTFTISGVVSGATVNGDAVTTSTTTTATTINFGTLDSGVAQTAAQDLAVSTNAKNGFVVTLEQDQNLSGATGADIDLFKDGAETATPEAWAAPSGTIDVENTYGHYGITSEDADLNSDEFGTALYAGNINTPRQVFSHTGPANGITANKGATRVGIKIEITSLQEADDYTNALTYIATPTF